MTHRRTTRRERAVELRNMALEIVRERGSLQNMRVLEGEIPVLMFDRRPDLCILLRTPFQRLPEKTGPSDREIKQYGAYQAALVHQKSKGNLPYGLDIWRDGKVLNVEWTDDDGRVDIVSYKPGDWELELERLAIGDGPQMRVIAK
jgi:hypothetical protein